MSTGAPSRPVIDPAHGFEDWWKAWPASTRKAAKKQCFEKWKSRGFASSATHIRMHTEWMKTQADWLKNNGEFICAPMVYLNQERWSEWTPPAPKQPEKHVLLVMAEHAKRAVPMPAHIRERAEQIRRGA